jgi:hypothetical protein
MFFFCGVVLRKCLFSRNCFAEMFVFANICFGNGLTCKYVYRKCRKTTNTCNISPQNAETTNNMQHFTNKCRKTTKQMQHFTTECIKTTNKVQHFTKQTVGPIMGR